MKPKTIKLGNGERVVAVVPERCNGPGWSNSPVWVFVATNDGRLREECIQPNERTPQMHALFHAGEAMCMALMGAVPQRRIKPASAELSGPRPLAAEGSRSNNVLEGKANKEKA